MTLGPVESITLASFSPLLWPLAAAQADVTPAGSVHSPLVTPALILLLCLAAGVGTFFLLPRRFGSVWSKKTGVGLLLFAGITLGLFLLSANVSTAGDGVGAYFWIFAGIAIVAALRVVTHPRPVYSALYFILTVFATAGLFILLWAEFMAAALVLIYAGAILVTYVFVIMLAASSMQGGVEKLADCDAHSRDPLVASAVGFALMGVLLFVIFDRAQSLPESPRTFTYFATKTMPGGRPVDVSNEVAAVSVADAQAKIPAELNPVADHLPEPAYGVQALGRYLFREQAVNLEIAGLLLTIGMIGAILIARRTVASPAIATGPKITFNAPATPTDDDPHSIPVFGSENPRQKAYPEG